MKLKVKPFTLFLYAVLLVILFVGWPALSKNLRSLPDPVDPLFRKKPEWTGLITLWNVNFIDCGTGSNTRWLNLQVEKFEKQNPGVFIDVRNITPDRMKMYFQGNAGDNVLPDIIALPVYEDIIPHDLLVDLDEFFSQEDLRKLNPVAYKHVVRDGKMIGVPYMMGAYALVFNAQLAHEKEVIIPEGQLDYAFLDSAVRTMTFTEKEGKAEKRYYGFCTYSTPYSRPLLSIIHGSQGKIVDEQVYSYLMRWHQAGALPQGMLGFSYNKAWDLFAGQGRVGIMLTNTRAIYQMRALQQSGNGFEIAVKGLPADKKGLFLDQIAAFGILRTDNHIKLELCVSFLKGLLEDEAQQELKSIGMFPVITTVGDIYADDPQMHQLEISLKNYVYGPGDEKTVRLLENEYNKLKQELGTEAIDH
ncbi:ABC transporter substrate-binding protein [Caldicoprobacter faecalis]|uniref:Multiple sugar transport system substrate-binding protein n=1 Tax=Caldicoprobacter faecalis TaxID=937334 RepID=A0A1I5W4E3_9FIRM|nr:extracellular solute-binding protein [Caldicoprobacter faecalis]SFQ14624.1 multiple sugar transport system substrate-binding protein [Caldicoprobacter faecalis]